MNAGLGDGQASLVWSSRLIPSSCHGVSENCGSGSQGSDLMAAVGAWRRWLSSSHSEGSFFHACWVAGGANSDRMRPGVDCFFFFFCME